MKNSLLVLLIVIFSSCSYDIGTIELKEIEPEILDIRDYEVLFRDYTNNDFTEFKYSNPVAFPLFWTFDSDVWKKYKINQFYSILVTNNYGDIGTYFFILKQNRPIGIFSSFKADSVFLFKNHKGNILIRQTVDYDEITKTTQHIFLKHIEQDLSKVYFLDEKNELYMAGDTILYSSFSKIEYSKSKIYLRFFIQGKSLSQEILFQDSMRLCMEDLKTNNDFYYPILYSDIMNFSFIQ
jgi:hypothetical protein